MTAQVVNAVAGVIGAAFWPVVVIVIVLLFRGPIREILLSLESLTLRIGHQEVHLSRVVDRAAERLIRSNPRAAKDVTPEQVAEANRVAEIADRAGQPLAREQMLDLARDYESIRASMPHGDARTQREELVVTKMRTLALAAEPYLSEFSHSPSAGQRLAAIAILQITPDSQYWDWLADRFHEEQAFIVYQAGVALVAAVRTSERADRDRLRRSLLQARECLGENLRGTGREQVIEQALHELDDLVKLDSGPIC